METDGLMKELVCFNGFELSVKFYLFRCSYFGAKYFPTSPYACYASYM